MRKILTYAALALLTLGFTACQQEEDFALQEQEINLSITAGGVQTRVNTLEGGNVWENGDQVKIERTIKYDSDYYTYTVSVVENGTPIWTLDKKLYWRRRGAYTRGILSSSRYRKVKSLQMCKSILI